MSRNPRAGDRVKIKKCGGTGVVQCLIVSKASNKPFACEVKVGDVIIKLYMNEVEVLI